MPDALTLVPWSDPALDTTGHDPRSRYVERFWLPSLGPTAVLLLRHLATQFDLHPTGIEVKVADTSRALGLGDRAGNSSPLVRTLARLEQFDLACNDGDHTIAVRRMLPPINPRHVRRLPGELQVEHSEWAEARLEEGPQLVARRRARLLALGLFEQGIDRDEIEHTLFACGFHPAVSHDASRWAYERHRDAAREAGLVSA